MMAAKVVPAPTEEQLLAFGTLLARSGKIIESEIFGTSMGRSLPPRCRIRIEQLPAEEYRVGQVVAFVQGSAIFAHRINYRTRCGVLTRGDEHSWCDLPVPIEAVLGAITEWFIHGEWQPFANVPQSLHEQPWGIRALELAVRASMQVNIRLARHTSRMLMHLVRLRHRLTAEFFRDR
jgi:hypothetical protein